jgi:hypothetical protein
VGLAETKKFAEGYDAIFGKKSASDEAPKPRARAKAKAGSGRKKKKISKKK